MGDLRPYVNAWEEHQLKAVAAAAFMTRQREAAEVPAQGLDAHVALLRAWLLGPGRDHEGTLILRDSGTEEQRTCWDAAVTTQAHYATQSPTEAAGAVAAMVNQGMRLAERSTWFTDGRLVARAIEELARFTVFDSDVPSRRAQEWWGRVWTLSTTPLPSDPADARERQREHAATEAVWLTAWERWAGGDDGHGHTHGPHRGGR